MLHSSTAAPGEDTHSRALADLENGRHSAAIRALDLIIASDPSNLGAWLDLGIAHCLAGNADAASRIFLTLEARDDLPTGVAEVLAFYRTGGCRPLPLGLQGFISIGTGYATNVNLAPLSGLVSLPGLGLDLTLQSESRPRRSPLNQLELGAVYALTRDQAWTVAALGQVQRYGEASELGLDTTQVSLSYRRPSPLALSESQVSYSQLWLGGRPHVGALSASGQMLRHAVGPLSLGLAGNVTRLSFSELTSFDAVQYDARARAILNSGSTRLTLDAGWIEDRPTGDRAGGRRHGPVAQARLQMPVGKLGSLDFIARRSWLRDANPYNEVLFADLVRSSQQLSFQAAWRIPVAPQTSLRIDYRLQSARDTISLFSYNAHTLTAAMEWSFAR